MSNERKEKIQEMIDELTREVLLATIENCSDRTTTLNDLAKKTNEFHKSVVNLVTKMIG